jgi:hypothetical protein
VAIQQINKVWLALQIIVLLKLEKLNKVLKPGNYQFGIEFISVDGLGKRGAFVLHSNAGETV